MVDNQVFDESREQSQIKARIVEKYLWAWAKVIIPTAKRRENRILYIDLFAGPGRYDDGTLSTPLLVLKKAIADPDMRSMLVTFFNDKDADNAGKLEAAIQALPDVGKLKYKPLVSNEIVGEQIEKKLAGLRLIPTFFFVDPWGYKGLSLGLINSVLQNWGSDCVFFFNYNRVNMGLNNDAVRQHMDALFGRERADDLRGRLAGLGPENRENLIVEELCAALKEMGGSYVLPFAFKNELGTRTSHHLIFVTKHFKGYEIMKGIMARESSERHQGVASFEYSPTSERFPILFGLSRPLDELQEALLNCFAGETLTMKEIYLRHCVGTPYIDSNYKRALVSLEAENKIRVEPPASERPKKKGEATFADHVRVTFPRKPK
ncbi:MAG: three-Cys-motif partner protein TcmP [Terriglobales bacterium]|jgi:three-Cys-motif partner protein